MALILIPHMRIPLMGSNEALQDFLQIMAKATVHTAMNSMRVSVGLSQIQLVDLTSMSSCQKILIHQKLQTFMLKVTVSVFTAIL